MNWESRFGGIFYVRYCGEAVVPFDIGLPDCGQMQVAGPDVGYKRIADLRIVQRAAQQTAIDPKRSLNIS